MKPWKKLFLLNYKESLHSQSIILWATYFSNVYLIIKIIIVNTNNFNNLIFYTQQDAIYKVSITLFLKVRSQLTKYWVSEDRGPPPHTRLEDQVRPKLTFGTDNLLAGAKIAQSVWRLAMGWRTQESEFESRLFCSSRRPARVWGPTSLLSNGYRGRFIRG
jgi:hypothetical protein